MYINTQTHTHYLQNNHLLPLVHHYVSLNYIAVYTLIAFVVCCCDAVTLDKGSCQENQWSHCKRNHHSGKPLHHKWIAESAIDMSALKILLFQLKMQRVDGLTVLVHDTNNFYIEEKFK